MTIERLAQFTAETRVLTDLSLVTGTDVPAISSVQAKTGTYSYRVQTTDAPWGAGFSSPKTAIRIGFWLYMNSTSVDDGIIYRVGYSTANTTTSMHLRIYYNDATGTLQILRPLDNTDYEELDSIAVPSVFLTTGTWFHVGITHKIDSADGFITMYINGTSVMEFVGDTRPSRFNFVEDPDVVEYVNDTPFVHIMGRLNSAAGGFSDVFVDDVFVDSIVGEDDAPVPSRRFLMVLPTGAGEDAEWIPLSSTNVSNVDDNPNDGDATYNKALAADLRDTFAMGDITLPVDHRIVAVLPSPFAKRLDSEIQHLLSVHAWDGLQYEDSADLDLSMSYDVPVFARFTLQPDGSAWTEGDFNAMEFGYRARGTF